MKKILVVILVLILIVGGIFIYKHNPFGNGIVEVDDGYTQQQITELKNNIKQNLPIMDGSTSLIPLEAGIRASLYGITQEEAEAQVTHSTSYGSFYNLVNKEVDLIFSTPLSQEQLAMAEERNMELEMIPVAKEAFVFVVNASNPVESLTQQQIKDIYSGKITNWKEVGGNDAQIIAYQRNETSGSQNYMKIFMGNTELMKPVGTYIPTSMIGLMDAIAVYDNAENAIGYSVYAYAADMYGNGNEIKFIKVDGVEPTKQTMANGQYPLLGENYAVFDKAKEENSTTRLLVEWLLTNDGQRAVSAAGYIPIRPINVNEQVIDLYNKKGTAKQKPTNYQRANTYYSYDFSNNNEEQYQYIGDKYVIGEETPSNIYVNGLKNEKLQAEINKFIDDTIIQISDKANKNFKDGYKIDLPNDESGDEFEIYQIKPEIIVEKQCINGYLSVFVYMPYEFRVQSGWTYVYYGKSVVYDLYSGKKLQLSDLFYKDVEFVNEINSRIKNEKIFRGELTPDVETKRDFIGIPNNMTNFTLSGVFFEKNNPYFANGEIFDYDMYFKDMYVVYEQRDMKDIFVDTTKIKEEYFTTFAHNYKKVVNEEEKIEYNLAIVDTNNQVVDNKINEFIENYVKMSFNKYYIDKNYTFDGDIVYSEYSAFDTSYKMYGTEKIEYDVYAGENIAWATTKVLLNAHLEFDLQTGELISSRSVNIEE